MSPLCASSQVDAPFATQKLLLLADKLGEDEVGRMVAALGDVTDWLAWQGLAALGDNVGLLAGFFKGKLPPPAGGWTSGPPKGFAVWTTFAHPGPERR